MKRVSRRIPPPSGGKQALGRRSRPPCPYARCYGADNHAPAEVETGGTCLAMKHLSTIPGGDSGGREYDLPTIGGLCSEPRQGHPHDARPSTAGTVAGEFSVIYQM